MMQRRSDLKLTSSSSSGAVHTVPFQGGLTIRDLLDILNRRRAAILTTFLLCVASAAILFGTSTRLYKGSAEIQVQKDTADALSLNNVMGSSDSASDAVESNVTLQTEAKILQSESLAIRVIKKLNLEDTADFQPKFSLIGWVLGHFTPPGTPDPAGVSLEDAPGRRNHSLKVFESHLKVTPVSGTRLIDVGYLSSDRKNAAAVANLLVQNLIEYNFETRHNATQQASGWLGDQLSELRKRSDELQSRVIELQRNSGVFTLGQTDNQGHEQVYTPVLDRLQQATSQLAQAESARIMKGALYQVVKDGDPELISGLAGNSTLTGATSGITGSLSLLQSLRTQEAQTQAQLNQMSEKFGPAYPKLTEVQANLEGTRKAIRQEAGRVASRVKNDYLIAEQVEKNNRTTYETQKTEAEASNGKAIEYEIVTQEAAQTRNLYGSLLQRLKEADLIAGLHSTNITLVDAASVPSRPAKPNLLLYLAGGIVGGMLLAVCAALLFDAMDNRIQNFADVDALSTGAPIAFLPYHFASDKSGRLRSSRDNTPAFAFRSPKGGYLRDGETEAMVAAVAPRAPYTEALRALRTSLGSMEDQPPQVILVTSSVPGEGKSMLSMNLAIVYAQRGKRVLLVDGDLRTPVLHERLKVSGQQGLSSLLSPAVDQREPIKPTRLPLENARNLDFLPAGPVPDYPAELLESDQMAEMILRWRGDYDYVFIDGAPLLPVTDSALLSRYADYTVVVARHRKTDRVSLERTCQILRAQGVRNMGVVLNGVRASSGAQYEYYGYKQNAYQGSEVNA
jgi:polysaccharide biosynthesis transport protein